MTKNYGGGVTSKISGRQRRYVFIYIYIIIAILFLLLYLGSLKKIEKVKLFCKYCFLGQKTDEM